MVSRESCILTLSAVLSGKLCMFSKLEQGSGYPLPALRAASPRGQSNLDSLYVFSSAGLVLDQTPCPPFRSPEVEQFELWGCRAVQGASPKALALVRCAFCLKPQPRRPPRGPGASASRSHALAVCRAASTLGLISADAPPLTAACRLPAPARGTCQGSCAGDSWPTRCL